MAIGALEGLSEALVELSQQATERGNNLLAYLLRMAAMEALELELNDAKLVRYG